jgi:AcrR family transcriptional regulator
MSSRIEGGILDIATQLFADRGFHGVTTRDVAEAAAITEASIFRLFTNKDTLFRRTLEKALEQTVEPAQFLYLIYEGEMAGKMDRDKMLASVVLQWYLSLSPKAARLFLQAYLLEDWREMAYSRIYKIIEILGVTLHRDQDGRKSRKAKKEECALAARGIIFALLQFKMTYASASSAKEETDAVTSIVREWLRTVI